MDKFNIIFAFYDELLLKLLDLAAEFNFDAEHPLHLHSVALYGSVLELSSSMKPLYLSEHYSAIPIIQRSLLEAHVDLENLSKDPKYGYSLEISFLEESLKFLNEAQKDQNIYMGIIAQEPDLHARIGQFKSEIEKLKKKGHRKLNNFEKFQKAHFIDEYRTIYNMLCCASHNNYRALRDRHMNFGEGKVKVEYFKMPDYEELEIWFGSTCEILVRSSFSIHQLLKSKSMPELEKIRIELNKIRGEA